MRLTLAICSSRAPFAERMLGLEYEFRRGGFLGVEYGGRHVMVQVMQPMDGVSDGVMSERARRTARRRAALVPCFTLPAGVTDGPTDRQTD